MMVNLEEVEVELLTPILRKTNSKTINLLITDEMAGQMQKSTRITMAGCVIYYNIPGKQNHHIDK